MIGLPAQKCAMGYILVHLATHLSLGYRQAADKTEDCKYEKQLNISSNPPQLHTTVRSLNMKSMRIYPHFLYILFSFFTSSLVSYSTTATWNGPQKFYLNWSFEFCLWENRELHYGKNFVKIMKEYLHSQNNECWFKVYLLSGISVTDTCTRALY